VSFKIRPPRVPQLWQDVPVEAGFLCDIAAVFGEARLLLSCYVWNNWTLSLSLKASNTIAGLCLDLNKYPPNRNSWSNMTGVICLTEVCHWSLSVSLKYICISEVYLSHWILCHWSLSVSLKFICITEVYLSHWCSSVSLKFVSLKFICLTQIYLYHWSLSVSLKYIRLTEVCITEVYLFHWSLSVSLKFIRLTEVCVPEVYLSHSNLSVSLKFI
jgi:hypothetical protein